MTLQNAPLDILVTKNRIVITFDSSSDQRRVIDVGLVLDYDLNGDITGVEIINLKSYAGANVLENVEPGLLGSKGELRISYDEEVDAFYLSLSNERSVDQAAVEGRIVLDEKGHFVAIEGDLT